MPLPVDLQAVVDEMDAPSDEITSYINRKTGELFWAPEDDTFEDGIAAKAKEVEDSDDWVALPDKFDIHEYTIMERYCLAVSDPKVGEALADAIGGGGAFRRFKNMIHQEGLADDWYAYRNRALRQIAADFLDLESVPYTADGPPD